MCNAQEHTRRAVFLQIPPRFWHAIDHIIPCGFRPIIIIDTYRTRPGTCGWELLHRWIVADIRLPDAFHVPNPKRHIIDMIIEESEIAWRQAGAPPMLCTFAEQVRRLFLLVGGVHLLQPCSAVSLGGWMGKPVLIRQCKQQIHGSSMIRGKPRKSRSSRASGRTCNCRQTTPLFQRTNRLCRLCRNSNFRPIEGVLLSFRRAICNMHGKSLLRKHVPCCCRLSIPLTRWPSCQAFRDLLK